MSKKINLPILDLCMVVNHQKLVTDAKFRATKFFPWIRDAHVSDEVRRQACDAYTAVAHGPAIVPFVEYVDDGIMMTWSNDDKSRRYLHVLITDKTQVRYQIGDHAIHHPARWKTIQNNLQVDSTLFSMSRYIIGAVDDSRRQAV